MQQTQNTLRTVAHENSSKAFILSAQMIQLEVVQGAVARLMDRIDEITHKGWDKNPGMACCAIDEIRDTVRLIDMALFPLFKEILEEVKTLNVHAQDLYDIVISEPEVQSVWGKEGM
ncbi:hypothetical protein PVA17_12150 [Lysinibacillus sp. CNPSo 3705]|uniref:hypothetical protein n=1 Tax=Lysinibacillus sp. CNPSo 3705 TaxID=3028148 RepID=UPI002363D2FC|nr:hypothetical protein [Lysinibacillus sp. CNPSo 3705]MDD1503509.1 hypothetical protein [Lysinibacillus sp. CNPSo 3705]